MWLIFSPPSSAVKLIYNARKITYSLRLLYFNRKISPLAIGKISHQIESVTISTGSYQTTYGNGLMKLKVHIEPRNYSITN